MQRLRISFYHRFGVNLKNEKQSLVSGRMAARCGDPAFINYMARSYSHLGDPTLVSP